MNCGDDYRLKTFIFLGLLTFMISADLKAQDESSEVSLSTLSTDEVIGTVNGLGEDFISVLYKQEANNLYAMSFKLDASTEVINRESITDIKRGDIVGIRYEETAKSTDQSQEVVNRIAKVINFIDSGVYSEYEETPVESEPDSNIKGFKEL